MMASAFTLITYTPPAWSIQQLAYQRKDAAMASYPDGGLTRDKQGPGASQQAPGPDPLEPASAEMTTARGFIMSVKFNGLLETFSQMVEFQIGAGPSQSEPFFLDLKAAFNDTDKPLSELNRKRMFDMLMLAFEHHSEVEIQEFSRQILGVTLF
jgi:hypothetical protein